MIVIINPNVDPANDGSAKGVAEALNRIEPRDARVVHYLDATPEQVRKLSPQGIIISGQGTPWDEYSDDSLKGVKTLIREADCPILGICGGHQLIALTYGAKVDRIKRLAPGEGYEGCWRESGFVEVRTLVRDPLLGEAGRDLTIHEAHYEEVKGVPRGFKVTASNESCPVQAMRHNSRPLYGVQFHPERWDDSHADGKEVLKRFLALCTEHMKG